jgi:glycosyltransferase involved in cell wall biosynthesis
VVPTKKTRALLPRWAQPKARLELAIGIKPEEREHPDNFDTPRVLSTGRLLYWKGNHLGLRAFAELKKRFPEARMSICGDGPEGKRLEQICDELGIRASVDFLYNYNHQQALALYNTHNVFLSPILHLGGFAVLEAMNAGIPVVELDSGDDMGPVTGETGIRVPMKNADQVVRDLGEALGMLAADPSRAKRMGKAGQRRIRNVYDWNHKAEVVSRLYEDMARQEGL